MNNSQLIIKAKSKDEAVEIAAGIESVSESETAVVQSLRFLKDNVHFQRYVREIINSDIESERLKLEAQNDPVEMYRIQGGIKALNRIKNIEHYRKIYQVKADRKHGEK